MVEYQYTYFIGVLLGLILWLILYYKRKDTRKEMLTLSVIFAITAPFAAYVHLKDWWNPTTILGTPIGIEDILFAFVIGGIASIIYEHLFNKKVKIKKTTKIKEEKKDIRLISMVLLMLIIYFGGFYLLKINTFILAILSFAIPTLIIYLKRPDLIKNSILSGIFIALLAFVGYNILLLISPGFFDAIWKFENIGKIIILNIPLEEYVWYFFFGAFFGPLYEYWKEGKLINIGK